MAYLYAITIKAPPGTNAVELAAAFALEHGATIAATAAPIPGAYAGYQLAGTTGAIAGGVAGHLAGAASNPETREQLQELGTLLKDRASDAYGHYSQQARESYNHYSQQAGQAIDQARHDAVNRYNAARDGAVDGYNRLRDGAVNRAQQAGQALSETYTQTRDSVGQGAQQVKDFALEQGPKIAATAAPIPGAYAGYQLTGTTTGAIAGGVAGHLAGAALNPETREPLQELITLLKNRASGGVTHYSQQAGQAIGQARDGAVNGYNTVRNGAVNGYNTVRIGAFNRTQQALDSYTHFSRPYQQFLWEACASALASVLASVYNGHSLTTTAIAAPAYAVALPYAINNAQDVLVGAARVVNGARQVANGAGQVVNSARELAANPETRKVARDAAAGAVVGGLAAAGTEHVTGAAIGGAATVAAGGAAIRHFSGEPT